MRRYARITATALIVVGMAVGLNVFPSHAGALPDDPELKACRDLGITNDVVSCLKNLNEKYDKLLNDNYKRLQSKIDRNLFNELQKAQRQWLSFRDANCSFARDWEQGTLGRIAFADCFTGMTKQRALELSEYPTP